MPHPSIEQKNRLHRTFIGALDLLDTLGREPDRCEDDCLSSALGAMACALYSVPELELEAFARPIAQRPPLDAAGLNARSASPGRCCARARLCAEHGGPRRFAMPAVVAAGQLSWAVLVVE